MSNAAGGRQAKPAGLISREAARDLSSYQYHAMYLTTSGTIDYADTSSGNVGVLGVLQNAPAAANREAEMATEGTSILKVNGNSSNIAIGDYLGSDSAYRGVKVSADTAVYFAIAMEASTADADLIEVELVGMNTVAG